MKAWASILWFDSADLSDHDPIIALQVRLGQEPSFTGMVLRTQALYTWPCVLYERWQDVRTGSSSLNFFQAVFTRVVTAISQSTIRKHVTQVAEGSYHLQLIRSDLDFILWPGVNRAGISHALCTPKIRIWCQSL